MAIQVIGREAVEDQNNQANQAMERQKFMSDLIYKGHQLKFYGEELKLKAKQTEVESDKIKYQREADEITLISKVTENASKIVKEQGPEMAKSYVASTLSAHPTMLKTLQPFLETLGKQKMGGEERIMSGAADQMYPDVGSGTHTMPDGSTMANADMPIDNQAQANMVGGGVPGQTQAPVQRERPVLTGISGGKPQIAFPEAEARMAALKTQATTKAQRDVEMEPVRMAVGEYLNTFDQAVQEMGGLETNALAALGKGKISEISSQLGDKPATFALNKMIEPVALQLGSWLNKGRPTEQDAKAAKATLARLSYTKGSNQILRNYLERIISTGDEQLGWKVWNGLVSGKTDFITSEKPATSRFTIRVKQ